MKEEVACATDFIFGFVERGSGVPRDTVDKLKELFADRLKEKYQGHWYPGDGRQGSGYRCVLIDEDNVDPLFVATLKDLNLDSVRMTSGTSCPGGWRSGWILQGCRTGSVTAATSGSCWRSRQLRSLPPITSPGGAPAIAHGAARLPRVVLATAPAAARLPRVPVGISCSTHSRNLFLGFLNRLSYL